MINECNKCKKSKDSCGGCKPARYSKGFPDCSNPFDDTNTETDTKLSLDYSGANLNYAAERHTDIITGQQLGSIINLGNLRDVNTDSDTDAMCSELIFHRYGECGDGCRSLEDAWTRVSIDDEGILTDAMPLVRGANVYGCPQYLQQPTNTSEYWYAGWRPSGQFGYYQVVQAELPKAPNGNYIVASQDPTTGQPIIGELPLDCILSNLVGNTAMNLRAQFSKTQEYVYIGGTMLPSGEFTITWEDWYNSKTRHVGDGTVKGQVLWQAKFDTATGNMVYNITGVRYDNVSYKSLQGAPSTAEPIYLSLSGIDMQTGTQTAFFSHVEFNPNEDWTWTINQTINTNVTFIVTPGNTIGPLPFIYIFVDWESTFDDEGTMDLYVGNTLKSWSTC